MDRRESVRVRCNAEFRTCYRVEIRPLLVATIQRLPQRTIESIFPTPGTVSPRVAFQMPLGPSRTAVPPLTSRIVQPSIVVGLVSGTGVGLVETFVRSAASPAAAEQGDDFAPPHSITSSARASSVGGIVRPSDLAVRRLMTNERDTTRWTRARACWCGCVASVPPRGCSSSLSSVRDRLIDQRVDHLPVMPSDRPR